jgi:hypothetical protein
VEPDACPLCCCFVTRGLTIFSFPSQPLDSDSDLTPRPAEVPLVNDKLLESVNATNREKDHGPVGLPNFLNPKIRGQRCLPHAKQSGERQSGFAT